MTHLKIEQNNGITEQVSPSVIEKLYEIVHSGNLDSSSNLMGSLNTTGTYLNYVDYLEELFTKNGIRLLIITANKLYVSFADSAVLSRMLQYLGDGVGITSSEVTNGNWYSNTIDPNTNNGLFINNTSITSFNELGLLSLITNIPNLTFKGCTNLTNIDLHNITSIGDSTFKNCSKLTSVDLSNVTSINSNAFDSCSALTTVGDLSNVTSIKYSVFSGCSLLTSVNLSNVTTIGEFAFNTCSSLTTVGDLSNVTSIGRSAFNNCLKLTSVGDLSNCTSIGTATFKNCSALTNVDLSNCTSISNEAFLNCSSLTSINLSNCISIGSNAFYGCSSLVSVDLSNVVSIGNSGFNNCTNLLSITSIQNVTTIGFNAFRLCNKILEFETLNLPNLENLSTADNGTFSRCTQIKHIVNLGTITKIGSVWDGIFSFCTELLDVILPETIVYIEYNGFQGCTKLKYIKVLSTQVPTYSLKDGHGNIWSYGRFFGEAYNNNNPTIGIYDGLTFPIYVKDELLSQYQSSDGWMYVGPNRLRPLSQFATDFSNE